MTLLPPEKVTTADMLSVSHSSGTPPSQRDRLQPAGDELVGCPGPRVGELVQPRAAERGGVHVERELLAGAARHPQVLLPVELQLAPRGRLEAGVRLRPSRLAERYAPRAAVVGEGVVAGEVRIPAAVQQVLVHRLLPRPRQRRLLLDEGAVPVEPAPAAAAPVVDVAALLPVARHGVPVQAVAPRDVAEVGFTPSCRYMFSSPMMFLSSNSRSCLDGAMPSGSIVPLARLAKVRWCDWRE